MYSKVYEAIYEYLKSIIKNIDTDLNTTINIEVANYDDIVGLLIEKVGSEKIVNTYINGDKRLLFKLSIKSFQNYSPDDNEQQIKLVQFLDNVCSEIKKEFDNGNRPIIDGFIVEDFNQLNTSSKLESTKDRTVCYVDIEFEYLEKFIF